MICLQACWIFTVFFGHFSICDPCQSILSIFDCKLINMPRIVPVSMISMILVAISIERSYATYKFSKYSADVSIKFYIIALIFSSFAAVSGFQVYSLFSLKSDRENYTFYRIGFLLFVRHILQLRRVDCHCLFLCYYCNGEQHLE